MGTSWHISYLEQGVSQSSDELSLHIDEILDGVESSMSTYRRDSEITLFNAAPVGPSIEVSPAFYQVLHTAMSIGTQSGGAYDVTVGPLVDLWGFGPGTQLDRVPSSKEIAVQLANSGQGKLRVDAGARTVAKTASLALDFSSIAKGYAVDAVADWLGKQGVDNYLVEVGGEMRLAGRSGRGDAWRIAVEQPDSAGRGIARTIELSDLAVATSGDYRNFFELDGRRYSHSIDPHTGFPIEHDLVSVTVVHPSAMWADGWATALTVLGADKAMEVARREGLAVYFIRRAGDDFLSSHSEAFAPYLLNSPGEE